jgi:hypothetical protein
MAKLKGPLFSLSASGAVAKTLVYFGWKGLKVVRQWVLPTNPDTDAQKKQRGYLRDCVAKLHATMIDAVHPLTAADKAAYAALASIAKSPRTWFNEVCKLWMKVKVATFTPVIYTGATISDLGLETFSCILYLNEETPEDLEAGKFWFGTSKNSLIHSAVATIVAGVSAALATVDLSPWAVAGTKYYMQFKPDVADKCEGANSGIFSFVPVLIA